MTTVSEILLAVLNSLWQAAVVAGLVWLVLHFARGINAATRYAIWWAVLAVIVALPAAPRVIAWSRARAEQSPAVAETARAAPQLKQPLIEEQPAIVTLPEERVSRWRWWIAGLWAALCLFRLWQIGRSYLYLRGVKRRAEVAPGDITRQPLDAASRKARLLLSNDVASPMAVGFLHPAVILPESLPGELEQAEMEHVLLHEAAHLARKDDWSNLLARLAGAALALHPVAWWILRQIEREREIACDDWVVARVGSAKPYARSLARMSELRWSKARAANRGEALASGIFGGGSRLGERIELLLRRRGSSTGISWPRVTVVFSGLVLCAFGSPLAPRLVAYAQSMPAFEAATIKPSDPAHVGAQIFSPGPGRFTTMTTTAKDLVAFAYGVRRFQVSGGPAWFDSDHYDISAKAEGTPPFETQKLMMRSLVDGRFRLRLHRETKELPIYELVVAKSGPRVEVVSAAGRGVGFSRGRLNGKGTDIATFAQTLSDQLDRVVADRTGLTGFYDFTLTWTPDEAQTVEDAGTSLFSAIQDQLGLRLEAAKGPVEILVIDGVEKPNEN